MKQGGEVHDVIVLAGTPITPPIAEGPKPAQPTLGEMLQGPLQPDLSEIPLENVLRSLNSMSSDMQRQLFHRLSILSLVHEANRWRLKEVEHFTLVQRMLAGAGVKL